MRSHLIKAALPVWFPQSGTNTSLRFTQSKKRALQWRFTCPYYGKTYFSSFLKVFLFWSFASAGALCSFLLRLISTLQHDSFPVMFFSRTCCCFAFLFHAVLLLRNPSSEVKGGKPNEQGAVRLKTKQAEWRQNYFMIKTTHGFRNKEIRQQITAPHNCFPVMRCSAKLLCGLKLFCLC